jgi:hypothetical protein
VAGPETILQIVSDGVMHKAVRVKLRMQWRPQEVRDARNMECLLRKAIGSK